MLPLLQKGSQSSMEEFGKPWKSLSLKQKNAELQRFVDSIREVEMTLAYGHISLLLITPIRTEELGIDDFFDGCTYYLEAKYFGSSTNYREVTKLRRNLQGSILTYKERVGRTDVEACGGVICKQNCGELREDVFWRRDQIVRIMKERLSDRYVFIYVGDDILVERYLTTWGYGIGMPWEDFDREGRTCKKH